MNRSRETKRNGGQLFHENEKKKKKQSKTAHGFVE